MFAIILLNVHPNDIQPWYSSSWLNIGKGEVGLRQG